MATTLIGKLKKKFPVCFNDARASENLSRLLFFAGFTLWLVWKFSCITVMSLPEGSRVYTVIHLLVWALLAVPVVSALLVKEWRVQSMSLLAVGLISKLVSDDVELLDLAILLAGSQNIEFRDICKHVLRIVPALLLLTVVVAELGFMTNYDGFSRDGSVRYALGFSYCVLPCILFMYLTAVYLYFSDFKPPVLAYFVIIAVNVWLYWMTDTRSSFYLVMLLCCLSVATRLSQLASNLMIVIAKCVQFLPVVIMAVSLFASFAYNSHDSSWAKLNNLTSNRIAQTQNSLFKYGVKPFGQNINLKGNALALGDVDGSSLIDENTDRNFVDSSFMSSLIRKGYIVTVLLLIVLTVAAHKACEMEDYVGCCILGVIFISTALDIQLLRLLYNTFLFYIWQTFVDKRKTASSLS